MKRVLVRLHTGRIIKAVDNRVVVEAEVYGKVMMMWLLSLGENIILILPVEITMRGDITLQ